MTNWQQISGHHSMEAIAPIFHVRDVVAKRLGQWKAELSCAAR